MAKRRFLPPRAGAPGRARSAAPIGALASASPAILLTALLALAPAALLLSGDAGAATITIVNVDGVNEGFNDPTPAAPVGGNTGTTIGQQRLIAFQYAADIWGEILPSDVTIVVRAAFNPLTCSSTSGVLGSAGAVSVESDFPNAPEPATWYPIALASKLAGYDLAPGAPGTSADDIVAQFNSSVDNSTCLGTTSWYYGLDGNHGTNIDLVAVLLHELGHGLGFVSFVDESTGSLLAGQIDIFSTFIRDGSTGLTWDQMNDAQRAASAVNTGQVTFVGPATVAAAPAFLRGVPTLFVHTQVPPLAPSYPTGTASFGPAVPAEGLEGDLALVDDGVAPTSDGCSALVNGAQVAGRIAVIDRGNCTFASKAAAAQAAGAIGVIIVNNVAGVPPPSLGGSSATLTIPTVSVTQEAGTALKAQLALGNTVNVTLGYDPAQLAGADAQGRPLLYAPNPVEPGSSISHFDVSAYPNLLMEPAINGDLGQGVDLTLAVFRDLQWITTSATTVAETPRPAALGQNVPNPFNPATAISFELSARERVRLSVYDVAGRLVRTLVDAELERGSHATLWDGTDDDGQPVPSGVYVYRLRAGRDEVSRRMALVK